MRMHLLPLSLSLAVLLPFAALAEDEEATAIHAIVARTMGQKDCDTDLGYVVAVGPREGGDTAGTRAGKLVREKYPKAKNLSNKDNFGKKDKLLGRHLVVLEVVDEKEACTVTMYGVGFGTDEAAAKKDALRQLDKLWSMRNGRLEPRVERSEKL